VTGGSLQAQSPAYQVMALPNQTKQSFTISDEYVPFFHNTGNTIQNLSAFVMTYVFGQVLLENDKVVAITVADDPTYVGPFGIKLGIQEDAVKAAFHARKAHLTGHRDAYDVVVGTTDTRTRDYYDQTDGVMIEMAAANPNDPLAPFNVISITRASAAGLALLTAITKAKVGGMYPDQHVFNFVSEPWTT